VIVSQSPRGEAEGERGNLEMERTGCLITFAIGDCTECKVSKQDRSITSKAKQSKKKILVKETI